MGTVGGSVTAGQGAVYGTPFTTHFFNWISNISGRSDHTFRNGAFGGSTSGLFSACINTIVQQVVG